MVFRLISIAAITFLGLNCISNENDLKQRTLEKIQELIIEEKQNAVVLKESISSKERLETAGRPQEILRNSSNQIKALEEFYSQIKSKSPEKVAPFLVDVFRSCNEQGICQHEMISFKLQAILTAAGQTVLDPIFSMWNELRESQREIVLKISIHTKPLVCRDGILEKARIDLSSRVRSLALNLSKLTCNSEIFKKHLTFVLNSEKNESVLLYAFEFIQNEGILLEQILQAVQQRRIKIESAQPQICSNLARSGKIENDKIIDLDFWLLLFSKKNPIQQSCIAETVFLKIKTRSQLLKLHQVFKEAVESKHMFHSTVVLNDRLRRNQIGEYWSEIPGRDQDMLDQFEKYLSPEDLRKWRNKKETTLGEKLFLSRWLKEDPISLLPQNLNFRIQVVSEDNELLSDHNFFVLKDQPFQLSGARVENKVRAIDYQGLIKFDPEKIVYKIEPFLTGLKPAAAAFEVTIPINGFYEAALLESGKKYIWRLSLK